MPRFSHCILCAIVSAATAAHSASIPESVKEAVRLRVEAEKTPSIVVGIVDAEGTAYFAHGKTSLPDGPAPDEHTIYEIGSITKAFTGVLLADMAAKDEVSLDDPIGKFLPEGVTAPTRDGNHITLEHLSVQTSGLPRLPHNFTPEDPSNPYADFTNEKLYECLGSVEFERGIGEEYAYSNLGVGLLGHLLELASGKSYEALIVERIANPLGMDDTRVEFTSSMKERLATGYGLSSESPNWDLASLKGAGALRSNAEDMLTFLAANLGLAESPLLDTLRASHEPRAQAGGEDMRIGLGWHILTAPSGEDIVWHNGGTGGYRTFAGFAPEAGIGVVVLTNNGQGPSDDLGFHLLDASMPLENIRPHEEIELSADLLERYVGKYDMKPAGTLTVTKSVNRLNAQLTGQPRFIIFPESETTFFYKNVDATLEFIVGENGETTGVILRQGGNVLEAAKIE